MSLVLLDRASAVATLTLNRPDALNALTEDLLSELAARLRALGADPDVAVIVLTGAGRAFSAGVDLTVLERAVVVDGDVGGGLNDLARDVIAAIEAAPQPVIAKVNGACFTGALELALACDLILVRADAKLGDTHARLGLRPTWGMTQRLPRAVGRQRARHLSFTAATFTGQQAAEWGLALEALPAETLDARVADLAQQMAQMSRGSLAAYKALFRVADDQGLHEGLATEAATRFPIPDSAARVSALLAGLKSKA